MAALVLFLNIAVPPSLSHEDKLVVTGAKADSLSVNKLGFPFRFRGCVLEMVVIIVEAFLMEMISKH